MVKQAEKVRKRSPLMPVFGLLLAIGLLFVAFVIAVQVVRLPQVASTLGELPQLKIGNSRIPLGMFGDDTHLYLTWGQVGFTLVFWFVLAGLSYFLVTVAVGKDPESAKEVPLPPRDEKRARRSR